MQMLYQQQNWCLHQTREAFDIKKEASPDLALLIGPEGGLSQDEIDQANAVGFKNWCIGERVLRTETAPVVALSILNYIL